MSRVDLVAAKNYAEALFQAATDLGVEERLDQEADAFRDALEQAPAFVALLEGPHIPSGKKIPHVENVMRGRFHDLMCHFVLLLLRRGRIGVLRESLKHYRELFEESRGISHGRVTSAVSLTEAQKSDLKKALQNFTGLTLNLDYLVDPEIIGGVVFKAGDQLIDDSLTGQLKRLRTKLMGVTVN